MTKRSLRHTTESVQMFYVSFAFYKNMYYEFLQYLWRVINYFGVLRCFQLVLKAILFFCTLEYLSDPFHRRLAFQKHHNIVDTAECAINPS